MRGLCHEVPPRPVSRPRRSPAIESNHQLFEWVLPPLVICPFGAHTSVPPAPDESPLRPAALPARAAGHFRLRRRPVESPPYRAHNSARARVCSNSVPATSPRSLIAETERRYGPARRRPRCTHGRAATPDQPSRTPRQSHPADSSSRGSAGSARSRRRGKRMGIDPDRRPAIATIVDRPGPGRGFTRAERHPRAPLPTKSRRDRRPAGSRSRRPARGR
jgi:hypothetical protein